jgi:hypothetical protein
MPQQLLSCLVVPNGSRHTSRSHHPRFISVRFSFLLTLPHPCCERWTNELTPLQQGRPWLPGGSRRCTLWRPCSRRGLVVRLPHLHRRTSAHLLKVSIFPLPFLSLPQVDAPPRRELRPETGSPPLRFCVCACSRGVACAKRDAFCSSRATKKRRRDGAAIRGSVNFILPELFSLAFHPSPSRRGVAEASLRWLLLRRRANGMAVG